MTIIIAREYEGRLKVTDITVWSNEMSARTTDGDGVNLVPFVHKKSVMIDISSIVEILESSHANENHMTRHPYSRNRKN